MHLDFLNEVRSKLSIFKSFFVEIQNKFGVPFRTFRSDNDLEYLSSQFQDFMIHQGMIHQTTCSYTSTGRCSKKEE